MSPFDSGHATSRQVQHVPRHPDACVSGLAVPPSHPAASRSVWVRDFGPAPRSPDTNPSDVLHHTSNDEVRQEFSIVFTARPVTAEPTPSSESARVEWVPPNGLNDRGMHASMRKRLDHSLRGATEPSSTETWRPALPRAERQPQVQALHVHEPSHHV